MSGSWRIVRDGPVARLVLESGGAPPTLSPEILVELATAIERETARNASACVVASSTPGIFAAGADLRVIRDLSPAAGYLYARTGQEALSRIARTRRATIAEIDGACYGGALDLALACDIRVASRRSRFSHPGPRLGIITGWGGTVAAPRLLGGARARRIFRSGEVFDARTSRELGWVDEVVEDPGLLARRALEIAAAASQSSAVQWFK